MFVGAGEKTYQGMIIGENSRADDLDVNPMKAKQLTNVRASGKDEAIRLTPPRRMTLEQAIAYIEDDDPPAPAGAEPVLPHEAGEGRGVRKGANAPSVRFTDSSPASGGASRPRSSTAQRGRGIAPHGARRRGRSWPTPAWR